MIDAYSSGSSHTDRREQPHDRVNEYDEDTPLPKSTSKTFKTTKATGTTTKSSSSHDFNALGESSSLPNTDWIASINANATWIKIFQNGFIILCLLYLNDNYEYGVYGNDRENLFFFS